MEKKIYKISFNFDEKEFAVTEDKKEVNSSNLWNVSSVFSQKGELMVDVNITAYTIDGAVDIGVAMISDFVIAHNYVDENVKNSRIKAMIDAFEKPVRVF